MNSEKAFTIRSYRPTDRGAVRRLCCQTGFLGDPIDPVYQDHELFADFLTTYYTDKEPESSFVLEIDGEIRGYLLGSRKPLWNQFYSFRQNIRLFFRALWRYPRYDARSRRFIRWMITHGWREVPAAPRRTPHFHINLLPDARKMSTTRALMSAYLSYLYRSGEKHVYGQKHGGQETRDSGAAHGRCPLPHVTRICGRACPGLIAALHCARKYRHSSVGRYLSTYHVQHSKICYGV